MRITKTLSHHHRGFTLIEALMASVILAFCVVGICGLLISTMQHRASTETSDLATQATQTSIETLLTYRLNNLSPSTGTAQEEPISSTAVKSRDQTKVQGTLRYIVRNATQSPRDLAVVEVTTTTPDGKQMKTYRLMSRAEMP